jgi:hypothetical protein
MTKSIIKVVSGLLLWGAISLPVMAQRTELEGFESIPPYHDNIVSPGNIIGIKNNGIERIALKKEILSFIKDTTIFVEKKLTGLPTIFKRDSTPKGYSGGAEVSIDSLSIALAAKRYKIKDNKMEITEASLTYIDVSAYTIDRLEQNPELLDFWKGLLRTMKKKKHKSVFLITTVIYVDSGFIEINENIKADIGIEGKIASGFYAGLKYSDEDGSGLKRLDFANTPVGYEAVEIKQNELEDAIGTSTTFNYRALVPGWSQYYRGDKKAARKYGYGGVLLIAGAGTGYYVCKYYDHQYNTQHDASKLSGYEVKKNIFGGFFWVCTLVAGTGYIVNLVQEPLFIKKNTFTTFLNRSNLQIMPYAAVQSRGIALSFNF